VAFGWAPEEVPDPQAEETFLRSKLRWEEPGEGMHAEMLEWYRRLIALRRAETALTRSELRQVQVAFDEGKKWLRMKHGPIEVAFNAGTSEVRLPVVHNVGVHVGHNSEMVLASTPEAVCEGSELRLPAGSVAVMREVDVVRARESNHE
jgi:maltooligosyltrehalose trehalohydrolase